jgi:hypothetical protein
MNNTASKIIEKVVGFNNWCLAWKNWHLGLGGRPDCIKCHGKGSYHTSNGEDDYNVVKCECTK